MQKSLVQAIQGIGIILTSGVIAKIEQGQRQRRQQFEIRRRLHPGGGLPGQIYMGRDAPADFGNAIAAQHEP